MTHAQTPFQSNFDQRSNASEWNQKSFANDGGWQIFNSDQADLTFTDLAEGSDFSFLHTSNQACRCDKSNDLLILPGTYTASEPWVLRLNYHFPGSAAENLRLVQSFDEGKTWETVSVLENTGQGQWIPVAISLSAAQSPYQLGLQYSDSGDRGLGVAVDHIAFYPAENNGIIIKPVHIGEAALWVGEHSYIEVAVTNIGNEPITELSSMLWESSSTMVWENLKANIQPQATEIVRVPVAAEPGHQLNYLLISVVDDRPDSEDEPFSYTYGDVVDPSLFAKGSDIIPIEIAGLSQNEVEYNVLVEQGTGTWCGWCPRGHVNVDNLVEKYDDVVAVSIHFGDPMAIPGYSSWINSTISGFPSGHVQRRYTSLNPSNFEANYLLAREFPPSGELLMDFEYDETTRELEATVTTNILVNSAGFKLNLIITENGVTGTGSDWNQANYYAGGGNGPMGGYESLPNPVPASMMVYDQVARSVPGNPNGVQGSVPLFPKAGQTYSFTFNTVLDSTWNIENINLIGLLHNTTNNIINNVIQRSLLSSGNSDLPVVLNQLTLFPNPTSGEAFVRVDLKQDANLYMEVRDILGRQIYSQNYGQMGGDMVYMLPASQWQAGYYQLILHVGDEIVTRPLVVQQR
jgi:hypothetical protein